MKQTFKLLHTSDWHLGRTLYDRKRYDEFEQFLNWLAVFIRNEEINALLVAGDIFDTTTPANRALELYYQFLSKASQTGCRHIVLIGGNHDSPSLLNAPKELLRLFRVHVVGAVTNLPEEEVIVLRNEADTPEAIICAVPYLRDKDIRTVEAGEKMEEKDQKMIAGLIAHYANVSAIALKSREESGNLPIIGMGHLFTSGGKTTEGDGVRELYVGGAAMVEEHSFPECFDYLALGHLHIAQKVGQAEHKRYCGSPIPMGFGEAGQQKKVVVVEFEQHRPLVTEHNIPSFQELQVITGNTAEILAKIEELKASGSSAWLEIDHSEPQGLAGLSDQLNEAIAGTNLEILRIRKKQIAGLSLSAIEDQESLEDLDPLTVFSRCLDAFQKKDAERSELELAYREIIQSLSEQDIQAL
jgi:exonuclease SbcD